MRVKAGRGSKWHRSCLYFLASRGAESAYHAICQENNGLCDKSVPRKECSRGAVIGSDATNCGHLHHFLAIGRGQMGLKWDQAEEIAEVLAENHPGLNPLQARL